MKDELYPLNKIIEGYSSKKIGDMTEYLCFFLFVGISLSLDDFGINKLEITYYNYGGPQLCDFKIEIEITGYPQKIYVESKGYFSGTDKARSKSIENSVVQFRKKKVNIEFGDIYLVFIPGQNNLNDTTFIEQSTVGLDLDFPRMFSQYSNSTMSFSDTTVLIGIINNILGGKKKISKKDYEDIQKELLSNAIYNKVLTEFGEFIVASCKDSAKKYSLDETYNLTQYNRCETINDLVDFPESKTIIDNISNIFYGLAGVESWETSAKMNCRKYLLLRYSYYKATTLQRSINNNEESIWEDIIDEFLIFSAENMSEFENKVLNEIRSLNSQDYELFKSFVINSNSRTKGLFYLYGSTNKYTISYDGKFYKLNQI